MSFAVCCLSHVEVGCFYFRKSHHRIHRFVLGDRVYYRCGLRSDDMRCHVKDDGEKQVFTGHNLAQSALIGVKNSNLRAHMPWVSARQLDGNGQSIVILFKNPHRRLKNSNNFDHSIKSITFAP